MVGYEVSYRWRDELSTNRGINWQKTAQDKVKWRNGEEAFLLQWSEIGRTDSRGFLNHQVLISQRAKIDRNCKSIVVA